MSDFQVFYTLTAKDLTENVAPVYLKRPVIVGLVETNKELEFNSNSNCFRYFKLPKGQDYPLDLNIDIENYRFRSDHYFQCKLRNVFRYLMDLQGGTGTENEPNELIRAGDGGGEAFDVISHRGALAELLVTPLKIGKNIKQEWTIYATCFEKKLYLQKFEEKDNNVRQAYHFKFVQHCFAGKLIILQDSNTTTRIFLFPYNEIDIFNKK